MRLFTAINFNIETKNSLYDIAQRLKSASIQGNFTQWDNIHLTIVFIGDTSKIDSVKQVIDRITANPFNLTLNGFGRFRRNGGDIYWIGVENNIHLSKIYSFLSDELIRAGFSIEKRDFKPHITLGREVVPEGGFNKNKFTDTIQPITIKVDRISLMKSERINGNLTYTEIYSKGLKIDQ